MLRFLVVTLLFASCSSSVRPVRGIPPSRAKELPALSYRLRSGGIWSSADARGKVVVVDVWATFCKPCKESFRKLDKIHALGPDVFVIGVSVDESDALVERYLRETPAAFAIARDVDNTVLRPPLSFRRIPAVIVLDRQGRVRYRGEGLTEADYVWVRNIVEELRAER